ncbi:cobalt-zinc-cadmium efflux system membrane fusion protein [Luteibacter rhizovicinus]|uniref:Cobalt-zinc-cadmium efflux system membrane fusion protein n=1 Tax=Luteibacter rhizovicinus TaxID=242606 RepID=A0A4R3YP90_9GAMM|nr:efflux RND transporter periplasmic adaptor subunit [Luteibacter rhizovicinus]TCV93378.1 cobalt-zinc-cadmium efflux system membrane fusion protein [Luteibacter rhizovicinus]
MFFRPLKTLPTLFLALTTSLFLAACSRGADDRQDVSPAVVIEHGVLRVPEKSPLRTRLKVQPVVLRDLAHPLVSPAMIEADPAYTVNILSPLTGRVVALKAGLGDRVARGQVLAVIASGDYAQATSDKQKAGDVLALARKTMERAEGVKEAGGAAQKDLEAARSAYVQAQAEYNRSEVRLASLGDIGAGKDGARRMTIVSPTDGSITSLSTAVGAFANDPNAVLMTVTNLRHVWVTANVAENEATQIAPEQQADVTLPAWPGRDFHGTVQSVSAVLDADTRRIKARIAVPNDDDALKPNMFATATFRVPQAKSLLVPQSALLMNNESVSVFVEVSPWAFVRRSVELGRDEGDEARVVAGLKPGDRIVVAGGVLIND